MAWSSTNGQALRGGAREEDEEEDEEDEDEEERRERKASKAMFGGAIMK